MDNIFESLPDSKLLKHYIDQQKLIKKVNDNWDDLFGKLASELSLVTIKDDTLFVESSNPLWSTEINYYSKEILIKVNAVIKSRKKITKMKVSLTTKIHKKNQKEPANTIDLSHLSFEDKIRVLNESRKQQGQHLCRQCHEVYTDMDLCQFCRSQ